MSHVVVPPVPMERATAHATFVGARQTMIDLPPFAPAVPTRMPAVATLVAAQREAS